ncbi:MAG: AAA family ATPase [Pseudomonadales bacterium]|nr:AAA family ATPase [Pseudomonadales bacterium]
MNNGQRFFTDRYEFRNRLEEGGSGTVFQVFDRRRGHDVALKRLQLPDANSLYRIKREFRTLKPLSHPNLIKLYDLVCDGTQSFFTMDFLRGWHYDNYVLGFSNKGSVSYRFDDDIVPRLAASLSQLVDAIETVHDHGIVHRDIKPANVMVLRGGRVILLDFGYALRDAPVMLKTQDFAGTPVFMSPEHMEGQADARSDWYSVGVMLRRMFFELTEKFLTPPLGLRELVNGLTKSNPEERFNGREIRTWLANIKTESSTSFCPGSKKTNRIFVAREPELDKLQVALKAVLRQQTPRLVKILGPSGIGKSSLIETFLTQSERSGITTLTLKGSCHLHEDIHFRSLDGLVDDLTRYLATCSKTERDLFRPDHCEALLRLFPVFGRIFEFAHDPTTGAEDVAELATNASLALRELLTRVSNKYTTIIWIDDIQWADSDSLNILQQILSPPDPPNMLVIFSFREDPTNSEPSESHYQLLLDKLITKTQIQPETIELQALSDEESRALLNTLSATQLHAPNIQQIENTLNFCRGNPLFLTQFAADNNSAKNNSTSSWINSRLLRLEPNMRQLLDTIAVAGHPLSTEVIRTLYPTVLPNLEALCEDKLLKVSFHQKSAGYDIYHHWIGEIIVNAVDKKKQQQLHLDIANATRSNPSTSPADLVMHYQKAGQTDLAARFALDAAESAHHALGFDRAGDLFAEAWHLRGNRNQDWWILKRQAEALASGGHALEAAATFLKAENCIGDNSELENERLHLAVNKALYSLYGGDPGAKQSFLQAAKLLGFTPLQGKHWVAIFRRLRFIFITPSIDERYTDSNLTERSNLLWNLARGASIVDHRMYLQLGLFWLKHALKSGDRLEAGYAMGTEATMLSFLGWPFRRASHRFMHRCERWLSDSHDSFDKARVANWWATIYYNEGRWRKCADRLASIEPIMVTEHPTQRRPLTIVRTYLFTSLSMMGELQELISRLPALVDDARRRNDHSSIATCHLGVTSLAWFAADRTNEIQSAILELAPNIEQGRYGVHRFDVVIARVWLSLYQGDIRAAADYIDNAWSSFEKSGLLSMTYFGVILRTVACVTLISLCKLEQSPVLAKKAEALISTLEGYKIAYATSLACFLRAELAIYQNNLKKSRRLLKRAIAGLAQNNMHLHALAAEYRLAEISYGTPDHRTLSRTIERLKLHGVVNAGAFLRIYLPGVSVYPLDQANSPPLLQDSNIV